MAGEDYDFVVCACLCVDSTMFASAFMKVYCMDCGHTLSYVFCYFFGYVIIDFVVCFFVGYFGVNDETILVWFARVLITLLSCFLKRLRRFSIYIEGHLCPVFFVVLFDT